MSSRVAPSLAHFCSTEISMRKYEFSKRYRILLHEAGFATDSKFKIISFLHQWQKVQ
jgi:hypothetical protein